jgi:hypothetical protein
MTIGRHTRVLALATVVGALACVGSDARAASSGGWSGATSSGGSYRIELSGSPGGSRWCLRLEVNAHGGRLNRYHACGRRKTSIARGAYAIDCPTGDAFLFGAAPAGAQVSLASQKGVVRVLPTPRSWINRPRLFLILASTGEMSAATLNVRHRGRLIDQVALADAEGGCDDGALVSFSTF